MKNTDLTTNLFGFEIFSKDKFRLLEILSDHLKKPKKLIFVFTPNPEQIILSKRQKSFAKYLGFADILIPDGAGLLFAAQFLALSGKAETIEERITGIDLTQNLLNVAKKNKLKVAVVGGRDYEGREFDGWKVSGNLGGKLSGNSKSKKAKPNKEKSILWAGGYNDVENQTRGEHEAITSAISSYKPDVLFVAFGAPNQEKWVVDNQALLEKSGISLAMVVGGTFDVLLGKVNRAPEWMQNLGLEWLYRLIEEPWRWRRQMRLLEFLRLVVREVIT